MSQVSNLLVFIISIIGVNEFNHSNKKTTNKEVIFYNANQPTHICPINIVFN